MARRPGAECLAEHAVDGRWAPVREHRARSRGRSRSRNRQGGVVRYATGPARRQPGENTGRQNGNQGDIRGYSVRTGQLLWKFRTVPRPGEFGNETWLNDSWSYSGDTSVWGQLSADEALGYVYAPIETPNNNYYG